MQQSDKIDLLAAALSTLQGKIKDVEKDSVNTFFKSADGKPSGYASLPAVLAVIRPLMAECGLSLCQMPDTLDGKPVLTSMLMHKSGQYVTSHAPLLLDKTNSQGLGSSISYLRRFSATAILGISQTDDDGNEASQPAQAPAKAPSRPVAAPKPTVTPKAAAPKPDAPAASQEANKYGVTNAQRKAIYDTVTLQMGLDQESAISWLKQVTGKQHSDDWTKEDVARLHQAIQDWK